MSYDFRSTRRYGSPKGFTSPFGPQAFERPSDGFAPSPLTNVQPAITQNQNIQNQTIQNTQAGYQPPPQNLPSIPLTPAELAALVIEPLRYCDFINIGFNGPFTLSANNIPRTYLAIINTSTSQTLYISFGQQADTVNGIPLGPASGSQFSSYVLDTTVPQNNVSIISSGGTGTGVIIYALKAPPQ